MRRRALLERAVCSSTHCDTPRLPRLRADQLQRPSRRVACDNFPLLRMRFGCVAPWMTYTASVRADSTAGIASIITSMPLVGREKAKRHDDGPVGKAEP